MLRDARFALRTLARSRGFTLIVVLTLALGIGGSTAIFTVVNAVVLRPLDYPEPDRLVRVTSELRGFGPTDTGVSVAELLDYQGRGDLFSGVAGVMPINATVTAGGVPERVDMLLVSWNYFSVLGVPAAHGRVFGREDDTTGVANVAVVSDGFWRRRLNADPGAVGRTVTIDDDPILVVGVMPPGFAHPGRTLGGEVEVWSPAGFGGAAAASSRGRRRLDSCLARLRADVTIEQARQRLAEYGAGVSARFPSDYPARNGWQPRVNRLRDDVVGGVATPMFVVLSGVGLLLLVASVNVAHLVLARTSARRQEMAIRRALGASTARLAAQVATESALLAAAGGALAVLVASWVLRGLLLLVPGRIPRAGDISLDTTGVLVTLAAALVVTVIFAFGPALQLRRARTFADLREGGTGRSSESGGTRVRGVLVAAEIAMATVLLVGAGLLVRTVSRMLDVPLGFQTEHVVTARIALPRPNDTARAVYLEPARRAAFYREALQRVAAIPGVERAAMSSQVPLGGFNPPLFVEIDGRDPGDPGARPVAHDFQVSPAYFETIGVGVVRGRPFGDADRAGSAPVAIVSETAARRFWNGGNPIGQRLRYGSGSPWMTVVGVAGDTRTRRLTDTPQPILYRPLEQASDLSVALLVRMRGEMPDLGERLAREIQAIDPDIPVYAVRTMAGLIEAAVAERRFVMRLLVAFGAVATALALLGIYGVMAYSVARRTREIGIRIAIGARGADVSRMVMGTAMTLAGTGLGLGLAASLLLTGLVESQLFGVSPADPVTLGCVLVLMAAVALLAAVVPARRAARVDPVAALRAP